VADETLHLPSSSTTPPASCSSNLSEPISTCTATFAKNMRHRFLVESGRVPPRVSVFLSRHGIAPGRRLRIEERSIKPEDALFVAGTLTENPASRCVPFHRAAPPYETKCAPTTRAIPRQQFFGAAFLPAGHQTGHWRGASSTQEMDQQEKIAGRAHSRRYYQTGGVVRRRSPYQTVAVAENGAARERLR